MFREALEKYVLASTDEEKVEALELLNRLDVWVCDN